jgi:hypothetical protein
VVSTEGRRVHGRRRLLAVVAASAVVVAVVGTLVAVHARSGRAGLSAALQIYNPNHDGCVANTTAPRAACAGEGQGGVPSGVPYVYLAYGLCVARGSATVTRVGLYHPRGSIQIVDWGVRRHTDPGQYTSQSDVSDAVPGTVLAWHGFTHAAVTSPCTVTDLVTDFAVSVKIGSPTAVTNGLQVFYTSAGRQGVVFEPFSISECTTMPCRIMADRS